MAFVKEVDFRLISGEDALTDYQHTPEGRTEPFLHLTFCKHCGMRPFSRGGPMEQFDGPFYAVNVACLEGLSDEERRDIPVSFVDGRHRAWERAPAITSFL
jgi:hypothetical protein